MAFRSDMSPESMVVEDGTGEHKVKPRASSGWLLVVVGLGFGFGLGTLVATRGDTPVPTTVTEPAALGPIAEPFDDRPDEGVSAQVPGFPDALVAVGASMGSGHDYLLWPVSGSLVTRSMTGGADVQLDTTGQFVALSETFPDLPGSLMSMGRFNGIRPVSSGVTSYAWHDSEPGELSYTTENDDGWRLFRVAGPFNPALVADRTFDGATVAAWGNWGFAIQLPDDRIQLMTRDGESKDIEPGVALASHETGWLLVEDRGLKLVSAGGGVRILELPDVPEEIFAASFSPDGSRVAVVGRVGVVVYDLNDDAGTMTIQGYPGSWVTWSSDSRFVVAPAPSGIFVYDLQTEESYRALVGRSILAAEVLPLSTS